MKLFRFDPVMPITQFGSMNVVAAPVMRNDIGIQVVWMRLDAGGRLGNHQAVKNQLFIVTSGNGWVQTESGDKTAVTVGQAAFWQSGEWHASGTETGMMALIIEGDAIDLPNIAPQRNSA